MKVQKISFSTNNHRTIAFEENNSRPDMLNRRFMYMPASQNNTAPSVGKIALYFLTIAAAAVGITINNVGYMKKLPKNIVELADKNAGLNKINKYENIVEGLKKHVLYPSMAILKKKEETLNPRKLKSGIILTGDSPEELQKLTDALIEHAQKLEIPVKTIKGKTKAERAKWIYKNVKSANNHYKNTGAPTIINLEDLSKIAELQINKSKISKVENFISGINRKDYPGIIWVSWTDKSKSVPCFYNNLPVSIFKLSV
ncbi:hypothetical protein J6E39_03885 [bacterium]|nr:hypothetical protein [bacterium]